MANMDLFGQIGSNGTASILSEAFVPTGHALINV